MSGLVDILMQSVGGSMVDQVAEKLGVSPQLAQSAISMAAPALFSAMGNNAAQPEGAAALHNAIANDHDGSILDNLGGLLSNPAILSAGAGILGHVLGNKQQGVQNALGQQTGLQSNQMGDLLQMLAPIAMGVLGRQTQQQGLDANGLSNLLTGAKPQNDNMIGMLSQFLDMNHDGNVSDDLMGLVGQFMGGNK